MQAQGKAGADILPYYLCRGGAKPQLLTTARRSEKDQTVGLKLKPTS